MKRATISVLASMFVAVLSSAATAAVPDLIPVQGVLSDESDNPVNGDTDITFSLYEDETTTTALWTDTFSDVDVENGFFTIYLGANKALDFASLISNTEIWLGIKVASDDEMDRFQLAAVPFAVEAGTCQSLGSLTEANINSNFLSSTYKPAWSDILGMPGGFLDGVDNFEADTNASTICASGQFLNGSGTCDSVPVNTNAATICASGQFLNGSGTCDSVPVDTNAATRCSADFFLKGDGSCDRLQNSIQGSNSVSVALVAGGNFIMSTKSVALPADGTCVVTTTGHVESMETTDSATGPSFKTARQTEVAGSPVVEAPIADPESPMFALHIPGTTVSTGVSATHTWSMAANTTYKFGCYFSPPANDWQSDVANCRISWTCSINN